MVACHTPPLKKEEKQGELNAIIHLLSHPISNLGIG